MLRSLIFCCFLITCFNAGAQVEKPKPIADSLLLAASLHGNVKEIKAAMAMGADVNCKNAKGETALNMIAKLSYEFLAAYLVNNGAQVNTANNDKITPLHWAVEYNNTVMVQLLLENGADLDARDGINETPLHWAAWTGNYESAKILLKYGANPRAKNNTGVTPIVSAERQEHTELHRLLTQKKFTKNRVN